MTYIFTTPQLAGIIQQALETDDPLVLENVAFLAELFYQDSKDDIKELTDQPWPERLADTIFEAYNYGAYEQDIRTNLDELPQDFVLSTITVKQIMTFNNYWQAFSNNATSAPSSKSLTMSSTVMNGAKLVTVTQKKS